MSKAERKALLVVMRALLQLCFAMNRGILAKQLLDAADRLGETL